MRTERPQAVSPRSSRACPRRLPSILLLCALATAGPVVLASQVAAEPLTAVAGNDDGARDVDKLFFDARKNSTPHHRLVDWLVARGPLRAGELLDVLADGAIQARVGDRGRSAEPLLPGEHRAILEAFGRFSKTAVRDLLEDRLEAGPKPHVRVAALEVLANVGDVGDVDTFLAWAQTEGLGARVPRVVREGFSESLATLIAREPAVLGRVRSLYASANRSLLPGMLEAVTARADAERAQALGEILGIVPRFDPHVLVEIEAMTNGARFVATEGLAADVRPYLENPEPILHLEAIAIAEHIADAGAVDPLIRCVEVGTDEHRRRALTALSSITGAHIDPTAETWRSWHDGTKRWWQSEAPKTIDRAVRGEQAVAARAIQDLSTMRIYRHELTEPLSRVLQRDEVELVVLAIASLAHLGSPSAVPHLIEQLEAKNLDVRRAAYRGLCRMTGEDHGDDPIEWERAGWVRHGA